MWLENERLLLHTLEDEDFERLMEMRQNPQNYRYVPTYLPELLGDPATVVTRLQNMNLEKDRQCVMGIYEKTNPSYLVGLAEFYDYKFHGKVISIGYRLDEPFWGRGIGSSAVARMLQYLDADGRIELVTAHVLPANTGSSKILSKNGFHHLLRKKEDWGFGEPVEADVYVRSCGPIANHFHLYG